MCVPITKVCCNHGEDKRAVTKAERGDHFTALKGQWVHEDFQDIFRNTIGSTVWKFKTYDTAANLPGCGRKPKISHLIRIMKKKPCFTAKD